MEEAIGGHARTLWRNRLTALGSNPVTIGLFRSFTDASYVSSEGEFIPRVRITYWHPVPEIDQYQYPIDATPYRIAASSPLLITTCKGGPPLGWQPPNWFIVHEELPNLLLAFLGKAEANEPAADVFGRARAWIAENATA